MSDEKSIPMSPPTARPVHPSCVEMHEDGYCLCLTVSCVYCEKKHAPHKPCPKPRP